MKRPAAEPSDEELMAAYVAGDTRAFDVLFHRYARTLVGMLRERGAQEADAREVVQQGFLQLHRARHRYEPGRRFRSWLFTIAFNLWRDELRRAHHWRETPLEIDVAAEPVEDPLSREAEVLRVRRALAALSQNQRHLLEMHWFDDLTYGEIAKRVGATQGAVKLRAHRAHRALRLALAA